MIELISVESLAEIRELREYYINELPYSQELHAEENVWKSQYYKIKMNSVWIGYFCVNLEKILWEFYLIKSALASSQDVFKSLIDMNYIVAAECKSYDHLLMSLCFDFHKKAACSAYLFRDETDVKYSLSASENINIRLATKEDFNSLSEISGDFFYNLEDHIKKEEVFIFYLNNELLGAGTCKKILDSMNYYDIGMVVAKKHRNKGIGTYIIIKLKEYCYNNNYTPVCGCWYFNYSSKKTLEKAGFIAKHRIIKFEF
jgi:GNAT superfamily N-acetyltransferase